MKDSTVFIGNLDPSSIVALGTHALVEAKSRELIALFSDTHRLILNAGCAIPATAPGPTFAPWCTLPECGKWATSLGLAPAGRFLQARRASGTSKICKRHRSAQAHVRWGDFIWPIRSRRAPSKRLQHRSLRKRRFKRASRLLPMPSETIRFWKIKTIVRREVVSLGATRPCRCRLPHLCSQRRRFCARTLVDPLRCDVG